MSKRKFRTFCNEGKCKEEFIVEIEDNSNAEQEAANALVRKVGDHLKQKHPEYWREVMETDLEIHVIQGEKVAFLTEDGSIVEATAEDISQGGEQMFTFKFKEDFKGFANMGRKNKSNIYDKENQNNSNNIPEGAVPTNPTSNSNPDNQQSLTNQNTSKFNWKHLLVIGGLVVTGLAIIIGLTIYFARKNDKK